MYFGTLTKPEQGSNKPGAQRPQDENVLSEPNWKDPAFIQWFFQPKPKEIEPFDGKIISWRIFDSVRFGKVKSKFCDCDLIFLDLVIFKLFVIKNY